jgi:superfamily II DNA/RNA helicase
MGFMFWLEELFGVGRVGNNRSRAVILGVLADGSARSCRDISKVSGLGKKQVENSIYLCWLGGLVIRTASPIFEQEVVNAGRRGRVVHTRPYHLYLLALRARAEEQGYFFPPALKGDFYMLASDLEEDEEGELPSPEDLFSEEKYRRLMPRLKLSKEQIRDYSSSCDRDLTMIGILRGLIPSKDAKLETFLNRTNDIISELPKVEGNGLIIFTQYAATADYVYGALRARFPGARLLLTTGLACIDAEEKNCNKTDAVRDFMANGGILVSTDVLSAGQNLQNAQYVANYDFPWNPVVLIQRIGRIDRAGSNHKQVYVLNLLPRDGNPDDPASLEFFLKLMTRIYQRLEAIRTTIGLDASTLGEEAIPKDFGIQRALADLDTKILDSLARDLEQFTASAMDTLANMMKERGEDWLRKLPNGIGAYKKAETPSLFILFRDESTGFHHWRFKDLRTETTNNTATEIINTLLEEPNDNQGDRINYQPLIDHMKRMKRELREEIESGQRREQTLAGAPPKPNKAMREIADALAKEADGEELVQLFRQQAASSNLVKTLTKAMREGTLAQKARELLKQYKTAPKEAPKPPKLKRICWCYLHPQISK